MAIWHVAPLRFAPAFRALGVCQHIWPFSLRDIWATLLSPKWAEFFVAQMAGDETSLPPTGPLGYWLVLLIILLIGLRGYATGELYPAFTI